MAKLKDKMTWKDLYYQPKVELAIETLYSKKETLYYLNKLVFYHDSLNLIEYYLKEHKHLLNDDIYKDLMFYVERKFDNEIPVKSDKIWF